MIYFNWKMEGIMNDTLYSSVSPAGAGNLLSLLGIATISDNHGNSTRGPQLTCAGRDPIRLNREDLTAMHRAIDPFAFLAFRFDGKIPLLGYESPLEIGCRNLDSPTTPVVPALRSAPAR